MKFPLEYSEESQGERLFVMFHNVQSLNKHFLNVKSDKTFLSASMISLFETWTKPSDNLEIEGFKIVHRRDCDDIRKLFGQIIYLKTDLKYENITEKYEYSGKNHTESSSTKIDDICIIYVYNSPNSSFDILKRHINEVITISKGFYENIIVVGDFNINLKIKVNHKFIEYMESFGFSLNNILNRDSTNAETQIDYCFTNVKGLKSDYFETLTSFRKPICIRKHKVLTKLHFDETKDIHTNASFNIKDIITDNQSDTMGVDEKFGFARHEAVDKNEQIDLDMSFHFEDLKVNEPSDMMEIEEKSSSENYEIIDSNSRKILDHFLLTLDFNNAIETNQISSQAQIIADLIKNSPFITMNNKDQFVRLKSKTGYSVQAFDSVYARTCTAADGNCLYSSLSIINIGSERLTHSMRLLAVNAMINNSDYFQTLCKVLRYSFEEELKRTAMDTIWGAEIQIQALSMAVSHLIYSYIQFNSDPKNRHYTSSNISLQELVDRFIKGTSGGHLKYIGYKSDMNKLGLCIYYNGSHYDALLPFRDNPQQFVPHFDIINMSL